MHKKSLNSQLIADCSIFAILIVVLISDRCCYYYILWRGAFKLLFLVTSFTKIFSVDDLRQFIDDCAHFNIAIIPLVQTFGHIEVRFSISAILLSSLLFLLVRPKAPKICSLARK